MAEYKIKINICKSEREFLTKISKDDFSEIKKSTFNKYGCRCISCDYQPSDSSKLTYHLEKENLEKPELSEFVLLCKACHGILHFDALIHQENFLLVNSIFTQVELIRRGRTDRKIIADDIAKRKIILLSKTASDFLKEIQGFEFAIPETTKILYRSDFKWEDE